MPASRSAIKPERLRPGDTVAAVTLSWGGPGACPERYAAGKRQFEEEFGCRVIETRHALRDAAWIAANPKARADDLNGGVRRQIDSRSSRRSVATIRFESFRFSTSACSELTRRYSWVIRTRR